MIEKDPKLRPSAKECLSHPWLQNYDFNQRFSKNSIILNRASINLQNRKQSKADKKLCKG